MITYINPKNTCYRSRKTECPKCYFPIGPPNIILHDDMSVLISFICSGMFLIGIIIGVLIP